MSSLTELYTYLSPPPALYLSEADGKGQLSDEWADTQMEVDGHKGCLRSFQALKMGFPHLKVVLSVGGAGKGSEPFAALAGDEQARHRFGDSARDLCLAYSLDGIDSTYGLPTETRIELKKNKYKVDWEHPSDSRQGRNFILLLETLRRYLPAPTFLLTAALPAGKWALQHIDLAAAAQNLNFINLMTYDFSGPWVDASGHHAQLYAPRRPHNDAAALSCETAVTYVHKMGVPLRKIVLGIPAYGRSFLGCDDIGQRYVAAAGGDECGPGGSFEYKDLPRPGASEHVDMALGAAYCCGGDGGFVTYDNAQTVHQKAAYVREQGLGGMFFWTATGDSSNPSRSLVLASYSALHPAVLNPVCTLQRDVWQ